MNNVKLVATDMDHTLLTEKGELPPDFSNCVHQLSQRGIEVAISSGRPLYTLQHVFSDLLNQLTFICDNGGVIVHQGKTIFKSVIEPEKYQQLAKFVQDNTDGVPIVCGLNAAYISKDNAAYKSFLSQFYTQIEIVEDLQQVNTEADKFTVYFPNQDGRVNFDQVFLPHFGDQYSVTVGDTIWIDLMNKGVDKGNAMRFLGEKMGITTDQMMAFGDTLNDVEMLRAVKFSYIVSNAHEDMKQHANYVTKSNDEFGVTVVLNELLHNLSNEPIAAL